MQYHVHIIQISSISQITLTIMYKENVWFGFLIIHSFLLTFVMQEWGL